jgi:hypothetical protein
VKRFIAAPSTKIAGWVKARKIFIAMLQKKP